MKPRAGDIDRLISKPPPEIRALLIFGPDEGLVQERVKQAMSSIVDDLSDAFQVAELIGAQIAKDPAILTDEANALSMMGGDRVVRVRSAADGQSAVFRSFLEAGGGQSLVVVEGGDLQKSSSLRKLFEAQQNAVAIPCYADSQADVANLVDQHLRDLNVGIEREARDLLIQSLGEDRGITRSELEKLSLYVTGQSEQKISVDDIVEMIPDASAFSLDDLSYAAASGNLPGVERALARCWTNDESPVSIIRALARHFQRLRIARDTVDGGMSVDQAVSSLKPPIFFKRSGEFRNQVRIWNAKALSMVGNRALQTEILAKRTGTPDVTMVSKLVTDIALLGRRLAR